MAIDFNLNSDNKSTFALLRTNPKLSANVKLVTDSDGEIFLSAFAANKTLSQSRYQRYGLSTEGSYSTDLAKFFKEVTTTEAYHVFRKRSDGTVYSDYEFQYENQYNYGAVFNTAKVYNEQYKILAPIWLDRKIPERFVIYRVKEVDYLTNYEDNVEGQNSRILDLLKDATIVKTFDLTQQSKLGKYLHKHVFSKSLPSAAIDFNFDFSGPVEYNGIDIKTGGFVSKREYLMKELLQVDYPEIFFNQIISAGFERNNLVSANLMNLEFMFDDPNAENYKIYRYFGLYVDEVPESRLDVTVSKAGGVSIDVNSVESFYDLDGFSAFDLVPTIDDLKLPTLNYFKSGAGEFFHIRNNVNFDFGKLPVVYDNINVISQNYKKDDVVKLLDETPSDRGFIRLKVTANPNHDDKIVIGDLTEIESKGYDLYEFTFVADSTLAPSTFSGRRFSNNGTLSNVAAALSNAITFYNTQIKDNSLVIEDYAGGNNRKRMIFGLYSQNFANFIQFDYAKALNPNPNMLGWNLYSTRGGSIVGATKMVSAQEKGKLQIGDYVKAKDLNQYIQIVDITSNLLDDSKFRIIFNKPSKFTNDSSIQTWVKNRPIIGKFSAYDFKDFDFDFYSTRMSNIGELSLTISPESFSNLDAVLDVESSLVSLDAGGNEIEPTKTVINSEYDRLNENRLKETATLSRVVPTIMKFSLKDGFNARNLPYLLTLNEAFGEDNISPNLEYINGRNIDALNMEHFHLNQIPNPYYLNNTLDNLQSYTDFNYSGGITEDQLKSTDVNYFELYFKNNGYWNGFNQRWIDDRLKTMFSKFNGGSAAADPSTVFRGLRYVYKSRKEFLSPVPTDFIQSSSVNDYKFGVVFNYVSQQEENNTTYKVIKNDKFKFICVILELSVINNENSYIDRYGLYTLEDILDNQGNVANIQVPYKLFLGDERTDWNSENILVYAIGYSNFSKFITKNKFGEYSWIYFEHDGLTYGFRVVEVVNNNIIKVDSKPIEISFDLTNTSITVGADVLEDPSVISRNHTFYYWRGGEAAYTQLLEDFAAYNFANKFNNFGDIDYLTITESGEEQYNRFVLSVEDGTDFIKPSVLISSPDTEKPKAYNLYTGEIGSVLSERSDGGYFTKIKRMNGKYNPLFVDVINFTDIHTTNKKNIPALGENTITVSERDGLIYSKVNNLGVAFDSFKGVNDSFGFIKNYFFHKANDVNAKNLLKLSESTDKLPLYPVIGEVAIDKKDLNILRSNYSPKYFTKALSGTNSELVHGTLSPVENKAFLVSTIMKVKDVYDITAFTTTQESDLNDLDSIRANKLNQKSIHWIETESQVIADFYLPKSIYNELLEDNIKAAFNNYVDPSTSYGNKNSIDDDLELYVYKNIVNRFIIDSISVYGIELKAGLSAFDSVSDPSIIKDGGYVEQTNYEIQGYQNDELSFRLVYNKKYGYGHTLRVHIKIEA